VCPEGQRKTFCMGDFQNRTGQSKAEQKGETGQKKSAL